MQLNSPMLIWKSARFFMMEDTPVVHGELVSYESKVTDIEMIHALTQKGYGESDKENLILTSFETLYLLYAKKLILNKNKKTIDFESFLSICQKNDSEILTKFLIYRDLRNRGYVVKDGFGFGSDFRVYERGHFG